jgi:hypothetical protein
VIHARAVLEHLPDRLAVLDKLVAALRPGGGLLVEDFDLTPGIHLPAARQFVMPERLRSCFRRQHRASAVLGPSVGMDPEFGRELPRHLVEAGLVDVDAETCSRLITAGSSRSRFFTLSWHEIGPALVATGMVTQREVDELINAFDEPSSSMGMSPTIVSAWGRRPT